MMMNSVHAAASHRPQRSISTPRVGFVITMQQQQTLLVLVALNAVSAVVSHVVKDQVRDTATCPMKNWPKPSVVSGWRYGGASEKCFCAYGNDITKSSKLEIACPRWKNFISTNNVTADKVGRPRP